MKSSVLARPNLKFFVASAILMLLVQHVITNGFSQGRSFTQLVRGQDVTDAELQGLIDQAREQPSALAYARISHVYEKRGDYKHALRYLRRADKLEQTQGDSD